MDARTKELLDKTFAEEDAANLARAVTPNLKARYMITRAMMRTCMAKGVMSVTHIRVSQEIYDLVSGDEDMTAMGLQIDPALRGLICVCT